MRNRRPLIGAVVIAALVAGSGPVAAQARNVAALAEACKLYAHQYAAATTRLHPEIFQCAYDYALGRCIAGGPSFTSAIPKVVDCGHELCEPVYTVCMCGGAAPTWKRYVGLGC